MSAPWGEGDHYEGAALANRKADVDPPESEEAKREREAYEAQQKRWQRDMAAMYHVAPETFEEMARRAIPRASRLDLLMSPGVPMSFAEFMAYRAGQCSIFEMLRTAAVKQAQSKR